MHPCQTTQLIFVFLISCSSFIAAKQSFASKKIPSLPFTSPLHLIVGVNRVAFSSQSAYEQLFEIYALNTSASIWQLEFAVREGNGSSMALSPNDNEFAVASPNQSTHSLYFN